MAHEIVINEEQKADFSLPYEFPLWVYETDLSRKPMGVNNWHWHDELQFCVVVSGSIEITVQEQSFLVTEGEGIFINAGFLHRSCSRSKAGAKYLCMNMLPSMLASFHGSIVEQKYVLPYLQNKDMRAVPLKRSVPWQLEIIKKIYDISAIMKAESWGYELEAYEAAVHLWKLLILHAAEEKAAVPSVFRRGEIKTILSYLHDHYRENIALDDIAALVHMSRSGCCRMFKGALKCTILDYLTDYRIQKSIRYLEETDAPVTEIAYEVGFSGTSYYIKQFRRRMGMTPGSYRNGEKTHSDKKRGNTVKDEKINEQETLQEKMRKLGAYLSGFDQVAVAFSGGVDSAFLLKAAHETLGDRVFAVTANPCSFPMAELEEAKAFCEKEGIRQVIFDFDELSVDGFAENPKNRCYLCKKALFGKMKEIALENGGAVLAEGSNVDDEGDYRPGLLAIAELGLISPLRACGLTKQEIRALSKELGLPTWNKPSLACLSTRIAYGERITREKLSMVERAEALLHDMGFYQVRVRVHGEMARIEVLPEDFEKLMEEENRARIVRELEAYGFAYTALDLKGYRTGSMNEILKIEQ